MQSSWTTSQDTQSTSKTLTKREVKSTKEFFEEFKEELGKLILINSSVRTD